MTKMYESYEEGQYTCRNTNRLWTSGRVLLTRVPVSSKKYITDLPFLYA